MILLKTKTSRLFRNCLVAAIASASAISLASCDSVIYDDAGDCSVRYLLTIHYTNNILNSDAFGAMVTNVNVALYDTDGKMVFKKSESRQPTTVNDFVMELDVKPGIYDIIAWCEGPAHDSEPISFNLAGQSLGDDMYTSGASLPLSGTDGAYYIDKDIIPLYYGRHEDVDFPDTYGTIDVDMDLVRDTNHVTVQLQNMDGMPIDPAIIQFEIQGKNGNLDWKNQPVAEPDFIYYPWTVRSTFSDPDWPNGDGGQTRDTLEGAIPNGVQAELTCSRFIAGTEQTLRVSLKETGEEILSIPLIQYLLLVRGKYEQTKSPQDYLDCYVDFSIVFFIDKGYVWDKSKIYINNWRVVPPQNGGIDYED